jgi:diguanylate cyclase (GGDEF)-like protein
MTAPSNQSSEAYRELQGLYHVVCVMATTPVLSDMLAGVAARLSECVPFSCFALFLDDEESEFLTCRFATGTDADTIRQIRVRSGEGSVGWAASHQRSLVNARPAADLEAAGVVAATSLASALMCPLVVGGRLTGVLAVYHPVAARYSDAHRRLLETVADIAAAAINNAMLFEQTQEDLLTDPITGLPNPRFLFMYLTRELARAERLQTSLAILVMDLDDFKRIKKEHGREVADRMLVEVAGVMRARIRPYDICVRHRKDEFILVLSGCGAAEAQRVAGDVQRAVDNAHVDAPAGRVSTGGSIGWAVFPDEGRSYEAILAAAHARMAIDKAARRGRGEAG